MSLEQEIAELKDAIVRLTGVIAQQAASTVTPSPIVAPVVIEPPPRPPAPAPVFPPPPAPAPVMPPPPSFVAAPPPAPVSTVPFNDPKGLIEYVMQAYKDMGREKGAAIGDVLTKMGLKAINEVQPSQYAEFYAAVETLK